MRLLGALVEQPLEVGQFGDHGLGVLRFGDGELGKRHREHRLHAERVIVSAELCEQVAAARERGGRVVAVGTTTVRALETAALDGLAPFSGETDLFIYPGYRFKVVEAMLTNFHLPRSSLLVLVSAFANRDLILRAYRTAVEHQYRFYSDGING